MFKNDVSAAGRKCFVEVNERKVFDESSTVWGIYKYYKNDRRVLSQYYRITYIRTVGVFTIFQRLPHKTVTCHKRRLIDVATGRHSAIQFVNKDHVVSKRECRWVVPSRMWKISDRKFRSWVWRLPKGWGDSTNQVLILTVYTKRNTK